MPPRRPRTAPQAHPAGKKRPQSRMMTAEQLAARERAFTTNLGPTALPPAESKSHTIARGASQRREVPDYNAQHDRYLPVAFRKKIAQFAEIAARPASANAAGGAGGLAGWSDIDREWVQGGAGRGKATSNLAASSSSRGRHGGSSGGGAGGDTAGKPHVRDIIQGVVSREHALQLKRVFLSAAKDVPESAVCRSAACPAAQDSQHRTVPALVLLPCAPPKPKPKKKKRKQVATVVAPGKAAASSSVNAEDPNAIGEPMPARPVPSNDVEEDEEEEAARAEEAYQKSVEEAKKERLRSLRDLIVTSQAVSAFHRRLAKEPPLFCVPTLKTVTTLVECLGCDPIVDWPSFLLLSIVDHSDDLKRIQKMAATFSFAVHTAEQAAAAARRRRDEADEENEGGDVEEEVSKDTSSSSNNVGPVGAGQETSVPAGGGAEEEEHAEATLQDGAHPPPPSKVSPRSKQPAAAAARGSAQKDASPPEPMGEDAYLDVLAAMLHGTSKNGAGEDSIPPSFCQPGDWYKPRHYCSLADAIFSLTSHSQQFHLAVSNSRGFSLHSNFCGRGPLGGQTAECEGSEEEEDGGSSDKGGSQRSPRGSSPGAKEGETEEERLERQRQYRLKHLIPLASHNAKKEFLQEQTAMLRKNHGVWA